MAIQKFLLSTKIPAHDSEPECTITKPIIPNSTVVLPVRGIPGKIPLSVLAITDEQDTPPILWIGPRFRSRRSFDRFQAADARITAIDNQEKPVDYGTGNHCITLRQDQLPARVYATSQQDQELFRNSTLLATIECLQPAPPRTRKS